MNTEVPPGIQCNVFLKAEFMQRITKAVYVQRILKHKNT